MKQYFVTGTDTEVGKTYVTCHLLRAATQAKLTSIGYKPISAGCDLVDGEWVNEDAANIQKASGLSLPISEINPIALKPPIAPHIAASEAGVELTQDAIEKGLNHLQSYNVDFLLMEGAGGWRLPLSLGNENAPTRYLSDVVKSLNMPVILVVGMRLGCLNHAMLTAEAILADGLTIAGWVANDVTGNMTRYDENLTSLKAMMPAPLLAEIPFKAEPSDVVLQHAIEQLV
ncbi:dethiobiotin synthase [Alteromonas sp. McT4-15]|uniref:dethiobiotin synthase n=1 Tax=Alteromonas sp. McT4-15 TaxID=2881256 RepID=UPI001CF8ED85|nr:dethiobiotin synthase [Alteromonas sp. McT4-15]MCB4436033.1 dethiobiotin synthase [Alteromonas sp. McT4-15]